MASYDDLLKVAKVLARATSPSPIESDGSLRGAIKRMQVTGVTFENLFELSPADFQAYCFEPVLYRLAEELSRSREDLDPSGQRKLFSLYKQLIESRFPGEPHQSEPPKPEKEEKSFYSETPKREHATKTAKVGRFTFSFSPAAFWELTRQSFSEGSLIWCCLKYPSRGGRLIGASLLFGLGAAFAVLFLIGLVLGAFDFELPFDMPLTRALTFLGLPIAAWKAVTLKNQGWF